MYFADGSAYPEGKADILCGFYLSRKLQERLFVGRNNCVYFYCLMTFGFLGTLCAGT
jgi:hypothetical protein